MSKPPWKTALVEALNRVTTAQQMPRVAVFGIGHPLRGDDAAGIVLAETLQPLVAGCANVLVIDAGPAPENFGGVVRRFAPNFVLLVDAAQMYEKPSTVRWLDWRDISGYSGSTHTLPPRLLADYLVQETGCVVALLGIQPLQDNFGAPLSSIVQKVVETTARALAEVLCEYAEARSNG